MGRPRRRERPAAPKPPLPVPPADRQGLGPAPPPRGGRPGHETPPARVQRLPPRLRLRLRLRLGASPWEPRARPRAGGPEGAAAAREGGPAPQTLTAPPGRRAAAPPPGSRSAAQRAVCHRRPRARAPPPRCGECRLRGRGRGLKPGAWHLGPAAALTPRRLQPAPGGGLSVPPFPGASVPHQGKGRHHGGPHTGVRNRVETSGAWASGKDARLPSLSPAPVARVLPPPPSPCTCRALGATPAKLLEASEPRSFLSPRGLLLPVPARGECSRAVVNLL